MAKLSFPALVSNISAHDLESWLPQPEAVVNACDAMSAAGEPAGLVELLSGMGAPVLDMVVTPLSARAALLSAANGHAFYHHELRTRLAMPPELEPEVSVWDQGTVPVWQDGVLTEPKYFSFFQDMPLPAYNPNYRRKWRPHELLHGAVRFFWHPRMTRFEMYVSSRLNELLPVVHWYGLDEVFRPRCAVHDGKLLYREYCAACEQAAVPYWQTTEKWRARRIEQSSQFVAQAWEHFNQEWQAIIAEVETGRVHEVPRPYLNSSSDAVGYMRAHWNRVTAWSFGQWMELFLVPGVDYYDSLEHQLERSASVAHQLISGDIDVDIRQFQALRARRTLQDVAYRTLLAVEWLDADSKDAERAEDALMPHLHEASELCQAILENYESANQAQTCVEQIMSAFDEVSELFPDDISQNFHSLGFCWDTQLSVTSTDNILPYVIEGLETGLPETMTRLIQSHLCFELIKQFIASDTFHDLGRLASRFERWITQNHLSSDEWAQWLRFEAWVGEEPRQDEDAELFAALPEGVEELSARPARFALHKTLRRQSFAPEFVEILTGEQSTSDSSAGETIELAAIYMRGELRLVVVDTQAELIFEAIENNLQSEQWLSGVDEVVLNNLLENGFVLWFPLPS